MNNDWQEILTGIYTAVDNELSQRNITINVFVDIDGYYLYGLRLQKGTWIARTGFDQGKTTNDTINNGISVIRSLVLELG